MDKLRIRKTGNLVGREDLCGDGFCDQLNYRVTLRVGDNRHISDGRGERRWVRQR